MKSHSTILCLLILLASCAKDTPKYVQEQLVGTWSGTGTATYLPGESWQASFTFEENGHYSAEVTSGSMTGVFDNSADDMDYEDKKFVVHYVDSYGKSHGVVKYLHWTGDILRKDVQDIEFSNKGKTLTFRLTDGFVTIYYTLERP